MPRVFLAIPLMLVIALGALFVGETVSPPKTLDIYFIDVEGGAATLIVTPAGESVLVDAGWPGFDGRDAKRIKLAMDMAGIAAIDHMIATHYHRDHFGGIPELAREVPIKQFYDHGKMDSLDEDKNFPVLYSAYQAAAQNRSITLKPGDSIPLKRSSGAPPVKLLCIASGGEVIGGRARLNPECTSTVSKPPDATDNARSIALLLTYGSFEFLDCGDLTWNVEERLVCPTNRVRLVDLYQVTHHGMSISNNPVLLRSVRPMVAVMNNGPRKGGQADTVKRLRELPSLKALYQLHRNVETGAADNTSPELIANLEEQPDAGNFVKASVDVGERTFIVTNGRTKESRSFKIR